MEKNKLYELFDSLLEDINRKEREFVNKEELKNKENSDEKQNSTEKINSDKLSGKNFEINLRSVLEKHFKLEKLTEKNLDKNKEFILYKMELFDRVNNNLVKTENFYSGDKYSYIQANNEYFFIVNKNLQNLYYYDSKISKKEKFKGIEENQLLSNDSTKFFVDSDENNKNSINDDKSEDNSFFDDIKFNLISKNTISFYGNNNNIPQNYFDNYFVKAKVLSKGKHPYAICFGNVKDVKSSTGKIHYPAKNYYVKLTVIKGQFDGAYSCQNNINLSEFGTDIIYKTFDIIPNKIRILFEFKSGEGGEEKVISQAVSYQNNANILFNNEEFYHIIIVGSSKLGRELKNKINLIKEKNLINFAILCLNDKLIICGKKFKNINDIETNKQITFKEKEKKGSHTSDSSSNSSNIEINKELKKYIDLKLTEFENSLLEKFTALIKPLLDEYKKKDQT